MRPKLDQIFGRHRTRQGANSDGEQRAAGSDVPPVDLSKVTRALSIRQPYAEQIMRGTKRIEYRSLPTKIRERVYIYASLKAGDPADFKRMKAAPGDFPVGVLVGTVELVDCRGVPGDYEWHLRNAVRLALPIKPARQPQPAWFFPFEHEQLGHEQP